MQQQGKKYDYDTLFGDDNQPKKHTEETIVERSTKNIIKVTAKTVTPLLQIDSTGGQRVKYIYEEGRSGAVPFFSANGMRGVLRRIMTAQQIEKAKEINPKFSVSPDLFYLYAQGAALDKIAMKSYISADEEEEVRANAPILSLFGAGLSAIEGKLAVTDLDPARDIERFLVGERKDGTEYTYSSLIGSIENFRTDAIKSQDIFSIPLGLDNASIRAWAEEYTKRVNEAKSKKSKDDKEEISHISQPQEIGCIIGGVPLTSSVGSKFGKALSDVELGGLVSAFAQLSLMQIGSAKRIGFGILDWEIHIDNTLLLRSESNPDFALDRKVEITSEGEKLIGVWNEWFERNAVNMEAAISPSIVEA